MAHHHPWALSLDRIIDFDPVTFCFHPSSASQQSSNRRKYRSAAGPAQRRAGADGFVVTFPSRHCHPDQKPRGGDILRLVQFTDRSGARRVAASDDGKTLRVLAGGEGAQYLALASPP